MTNYTYNAANQLVSDGTNTLTYDNNGNMTSDGVNSYTWDRANRLLSMGGVDYQYDGEGRRVQQTVSSTVTKYLLDIQPGLSVVLSETTGSSVVRNIHAPKGIHARKDASSNWHWMMQDGLGSVRAEVSNAIAVEGSQNFAPYGSSIDVSGSFGTYGFTGEPTDINGLVYDRARYYVPSLGMFASLDPFEGIEDEPMSINGYGYVHGNPVNWTDPSGEFVPAIAVAIAACPLCVLAVGVGAAFALGFYLWAQSHPDEAAKLINDITKTASDVAKAMNAGLCMVSTPKIDPSIFVHPKTDPLFSPVNPFPVTGPMSPITGHPITQVDTSVPSSGSPVVTTGSPGFPSNSPIDPGNVVASVQIPNKDEVAGFFNRTLSNYRNVPRKGGIYEYWEKVAQGLPPLYYVGSSKNLYGRLYSHVHTTGDDHPLGESDNVIYTVLNIDTRGIAVTGRSIFAAEQIRKEQLKKMGVPLGNDPTSNSFTPDNVKWWWEQGFYKYIEDWPDWLYPPT